MKLAVQVNGKLRGEFSCTLDASQDEILAMAKALEDVQKNIAGKEIKREIYVPKKLVNLVVV